MLGFGIQRIGSEGFRVVVGGCVGGWLAERERRLVLGRQFMNAASVQARKGMPGFVFAGVVLKSACRGLFGTTVCGIGTTRGVRYDIQGGIRVTGG
jgi:hypothetical protein